MTARAPGTVSSTSRFHLRVRCGGQSTSTRSKPAMWAAEAAMKVLRMIERHPRTGAAQIVEVRETVREIEVSRYVTGELNVAEPAPPPAAKPRLLDHVTDDDLLGYGVPLEWLADARVATEDTLFELTDHLPGEAAEALLELATGGTPTPPVHADEATDPFDHPDAQRRFRLMANADELERALDYPWEQWTVFLHPSQRDIVERRYGGPARVAGSAGTGKTVVALHRAVHLALWNDNSIWPHRDP